ncbi:MAG TPA: hypothetical protein VFH96_06720 [Pyrinomonadaceae bacterium]|nr:hypothetical protein [Pyrinomonadaceae bacterium]
MERLNSSVDLPRDDLIVRILRYLVNHPTAKDTTKGIEKWWLSGASRGGTSTEDALKLLVTKGWLTARYSPQSETLYSLNESYLKEIMAFLDAEP